MSGPKIVRIVTREELVAISERLLARVDEAVSQWTKIGTRNGVVSGREIEEMGHRVQELRALLRENRFAVLQKSAPALVESLSNDIDARLEAKATAEANAAQARRRLGQAASTMLERLGDRLQQLPAEIQHTLKSAGKNGEGGPAVESALLKAIAIISDLKKVQLTDKQRDLANRLRGDEAPQALSDWIASNAAAAGNSDQHLGICRHISELVNLVGEAQGRPFVERLASARSEANEARQRILFDSLLIDVGAAIRSAKDIHLKRRELALLSSELSALGLQNDDLLAEVRALPKEARLETIAALTERLRATLDSATAAIVANARREAVLKGLATLGYEVREGMATAWAREGKLVIRKPATPGYGIEIGGRAELDRVQMRAVAFDDVQRDAIRDRDVESGWCGDVVALNAAMTKNGGGAYIEKATAPGQAPIKVVSTGASARESAMAPSRVLDKRST